MFMCEGFWVAVVLLAFCAPLWALARRTIGRRAPRKLPRVNSLLTRSPVRMVGLVVELVVGAMKGFITNPYECLLVNVIILWQFG